MPFKSGHIKFNGIPKFKTNDIVFISIDGLDVFYGFDDALAIEKSARQINVISWCAHGDGQTFV